MALHFFTIPVSAPAIPQAELNAFLAQHRVLVVERRFVDLGAGSFWAICVDVIAAGVRPGGRDIISSGRNRIDYKQVLSPDEFLGFSRLRDLRKEIATAEAVPVYAVFTNEQLARVVQTRCQSKADLEAVEGIGAARIEKYGMQLLAAVATLSKLPAELTCPRKTVPLPERQSGVADADGRIQAVERDGFRLSQQSRLHDLLLGEGLDRSIGLRCYQPLRHARRLARFSGTRTAGLGGYARLMPPYTTGLAT